MHDSGNTTARGNLSSPRRRSLLRDVGLTTAIGIAILGLVVAINCNPGGEGDTGSVVPYVGGVATGPAPQVGSSAPDFEISYFRVPTGGEPETGTFKLSEHRGHRVWLNFWATWCPPCRSEMPDIQEVWEEAKNHDYYLLAVDFGETPETAAEYVAKNGLTFPIGLDPNSRVATDYRLAGLPMHVFIDADGIIREIRLGLLNVDGMKQRLDKLKGF
ncbi:MAG: TlpA disulfide reductase family protein [Dehalococcoidia bacterium]|nr:TlpA disulfide reductase family protein [Dehalococcoidia bacterium]MDP7239740.1 TlpA disulfide reductase family protein [Dehalococcoidia bacterium]